MGFFDDGTRREAAHVEELTIPLDSSISRSGEQTVELRHPSTLTDEQVVAFCPFAETVGKWLKEFNKHAVARAHSGEHIEGLEACEGRAPRRTWADADAVSDILPEQYTKRTPLSPADLEKAAPELYHSLRDMQKESKRAKTFRVVGPRPEVRIGDKGEES